jgi:tRNA (guanine-N7-)-methyltransferase
MDWSKLYPKVFADYAEAKKSDPTLAPPQVQMADIGCGYGGLSIALSRLYPSRLTLGMEIRSKVVQYVQQRLDEVRELKYEKMEDVPKTGGPHPLIHIEIPDLTSHTVQPSTPTFVPHAFPMYHNVSVIESNAMKFLANFFFKGQLDKIFFLFPDPHFKKTKYRLRIINSTLLAEYAYVLRVGGIAYIATDVKDLFDWMYSHFDEHPLFEKIPDAEEAVDPCVPLICGSTEESRKVKKQGGSIWHATFRRVEYSGKDYNPAPRD